MNSLCSVQTHGFHNNVGTPEPLNCVVKLNFESADVVAGKIYNYATSSYTTAAINGTINNSIYKFGGGSFFGSTSVSTNYNVTCNSITVPTPTDTTSGITVSIWLYAVGSNLTNQYFFKCSNNIQFGFNTSNIINCYINGTWVQSPISSTPRSTWFHIVATCRYTGSQPFSTTGNGAYTYYVNGGSANAANGGYQYTGTGNFWPTGNQTPVVGGGTNNCMPGYFDNFRIYNSVATPAQVTALYKGVF